ncbi:hypothetical protein D3C87_627550 [compost metagenome]|jgi:hypothetical protein
MEEKDRQSVHGRGWPGLPLIITPALPAQCFSASHLFHQEHGFRQHFCLLGVERRVKRTRRESIDARLKDPFHTKTEKAAPDAHKVLR